MSTRCGVDSAMEQGFKASQEIQRLLNYKEPEVPTYSSGKCGGVWRVLGLSEGKLATASYDHHARIYKLEKKENQPWDFSKQVIDLSKHKKEVLGLAKLGNNLFTGSSDGSICIWNYEDGSLKNWWKEKFVTGIYSMTVLDENFLATGSCHRPKNYNGNWEPVIKIWDFTSRKFKYEMKGHDGGISALVTVDKEHIASCSGDTTVRIWSLVEKKGISILKGHEDYVYGMTVSKEGRLLSASKDRTVRIWDVEKEMELGQFVDKDKFAHTSTVYDVKAKDNTAVTCSRDGYLKLWDLRSQKCVNILDPEDGFVYGVDFLSDGKVIAGTSGLRDETKKEKKTDTQNANVIVWDFRTA